MYRGVIGTVRAVRSCSRRRRMDRVVANTLLNMTFICTMRSSVRVDCGVQNWTRKWYCRPLSPFMVMRRRDRPWRYRIRTSDHTAIRTHRQSVSTDTQCHHTWTHLQQNSKKYENNNDTTRRGKIHRTRTASGFPVRCQAVRITEAPLPGSKDARTPTALDPAVCHATLGGGKSVHTSSLGTASAENRNPVRRKHPPNSHTPHDHGTPVLLPHTDISTAA